MEILDLVTFNSVLPCPPGALLGGNLGGNHQRPSEPVFHPSFVGNEIIAHDLRTSQSGGVLLETKLAPWSA